MIRYMFFCCSQISIGYYTITKAKMQEVFEKNLKKSPIGGIFAYFFAFWG